MHKNILYFLLLLIKVDIRLNRDFRIVQAYTSTKLVEVLLYYNIVYF